jgi:hypothetical protein
MYPHMRKLFVYIGLAVSFGWCAYALSSATIQWTHSSSPQINGYKLYYGGSSKNYTNSLAVPYVDFTTVNGLIEGQTYFFSATSYTTNADGTVTESDFSQELQFTVSNGQLVRPSAVADFAVLKVE